MGWLASNRYQMPALEDPIRFSFRRKQLSFALLQIRDEFRVFRSSEVTMPTSLFLPAQVAAPRGLQLCEE